MQAIILAAGMGKRLGELTQSNTKCMIRVNGITLIERMLHQLDRLKLNRIVIVVGYEGIKLLNFISTLNISTPIEFIENPIYKKTNNIYSLFLAKEKLREDDTILCESDLILEDTIFEKLVKAKYPNLTVVSKYESWMDGTVVTLDELDNIKNFIPANHFKFGEISHYFKTVNVYKFSASFSDTHYIPFLEAYSKALGHNEYYEQVLKVITLLEKPEIKALRLSHEKWYEIDDIQDLDIAESIFADDNEKVTKLQNRYGGYWRYPSILDFSYLINPYFPTEQLKAELKANFDRLITNYPSGIYINSLLASKLLNIKEEYICVGNGAAELIKILMDSFTGKFGVIYPTFEEYSRNIAQSKLVSYTPANENFSYSSQDLINYFDDKNIEMLCVINPDNPSGNFILIEDLIQLLTWAKSKNIKIIIDESFVDFTKGTDSNSLIKRAILEFFPNLIVIKSISKSYGVPGLRLGVLASANREIIQQMKKEISLWNINSIAEYFMQIFGKYEKEFKNSCSIFEEERNYFFSQLSGISFLRIIPSAANFFLCEVKPPFTSTELTKTLLCQKNILVKDCKFKKGFNGKDYVRLAIRSRNENAVLLKALAEIFNESAKYQEPRLIISAPDF